MLCLFVQDCTPAEEGISLSHVDEPCSNLSLDAAELGLSPETGKQEFRLSFLTSENHCLPEVNAMVRQNNLTNMQIDP